MPICLFTSPTESKLCTRLHLNCVCVLFGSSASSLFDFYHIDGRLPLAVQIIKMSKSNIVHARSSDRVKEREKSHIFVEYHVFSGFFFLINRLVSLNACKFCFSSIFAIRIKCVCLRMGCTCVDLNIIGFIYINAMSNIRIVFLGEIHMC